MRMCETRSKIIRTIPDQIYFGFGKYSPAVKYDPFFSNQFPDSNHHYNEMKGGGIRFRDIKMSFTTTTLSFKAGHISLQATYLITSISIYYINIC